jgi:hypothetical protein
MCSEVDTRMSVLSKMPNDFRIALEQSHCILKLKHSKRGSTALDLFICDNMYTGILMYGEKLFVSKQCNILTGHYFVEVDPFLEVN